MHFDELEFAVPYGSSVKPAVLAKEDASGVFGRATFTVVAALRVLEP